METPIGLEEIILTFGSLDDPEFEREKIVIFDFPYPLSFHSPVGLMQVHRGRCHRLMVPIFQEALAKVGEAGFETCFRPYGGIYARRPQRGSKSFPSTHSWGIAIDGDSETEIDPDAYKLGSSVRMPDEVVRIFTDLGFFYGGDFKHRRDPMHFQMAKNY